MNNLQELTIAEILEEASAVGVRNEVVNFAEQYLSLGGIVSRLEAYNEAYHAIVENNEDCTNSSLNEDCCINYEC